MQSMYSQYFVKIKRNLSEIVWFEQIFMLQYFREDLFWKWLLREKSYDQWLEKVERSAIDSISSRIHYL